MDEQKREREALDKRDREEIGTRLATYRGLAGYSLRSAAKELRARGYDISHGAIGHWETGASTIDVLWLRRLARLYRFSTDVLLGISQDPVAPERTPSLGEAISRIKGVIESEDPPPVRIAKAGKTIIRRRKGDAK